MRAHRVSWEIHRGPIPEGACVLHQCDNRSCVNPGHLFLGTYSDNARDMHRKGRAVIHRGEDCAASKLTEADVRKIRAMIWGGVSCAKAARAVGISTGHAWRIAARKSWVHVEQESVND